MTLHSDSRRIVRQAVEHITPFDELEEAHVSDILAWMTAKPTYSE